MIDIVIPSVAIAISAISPRVIVIVESYIRQPRIPRSPILSGTTCAAPVSANYKCHLLPLSHAFMDLCCDNSCRAGHSKAHKQDLRNPAIYESSHCVVRYPATE